MKRNATRILIPLMLLLGGGAVLFHVPARVSGGSSVTMRDRDAGTVAVSEDNGRKRVSRASASRAEAEKEKDKKVTAEADTVTSGPRREAQAQGVEPAVPEPPETEGYVPTVMEEAPLADPAAGLTLIAPPSANSRGSASLSYPLILPPARNGMSPALSLVYDSDSDDGWLGTGWDIPVPSIRVDTRRGVPRYDREFETETYLLDGEMLVTDNGGVMTAACRDDSVRRVADREFHTRSGADFARIVRKGDAPDNYSWEVTDRQGTVYTYGTPTEGTSGRSVLAGLPQNRSADGTAIAEWRLSRVTEPHGDWVEYSYAECRDTVAGGLTATGLRLTEVRAGNAGSEGHTVVRFRSGARKARVINSARYGFLTSSSSLLTDIDIEYRGEYLRGYRFSYADGVSGRRLLSRVEQLDSARTPVAFHDFTYHGDRDLPSRTLQAALSGLGGSNLLREVSNSFGGTFRMEYSLSEATSAHPGGKRVMSRLVVDDGIRDDGPSLTTAFSYSGGSRDPREKDFLGFGRVRASQLDAGGNAVRTFVSEYDVSDYGHRGNLLRSAVEDGEGRLFSETVNEYDTWSVSSQNGSYRFTALNDGTNGGTNGAVNSAPAELPSECRKIFTPLRYTASRLYEGTSSPLTLSETWNAYETSAGSFGDLSETRFSDRGALGADGSGEYVSKTYIVYTGASGSASSSGSSFSGTVAGGTNVSKLTSTAGGDRWSRLRLPATVAVTDASGGLMSLVRTVYGDASCPSHLTSVMRFLGSEWAVTDFSYDSHGNVREMKLPGSTEARRMKYTYAYEDEMGMYVSRITDSRGMTNEFSDFDYRYGVARTRMDINGLYTRTEIDALGRVTRMLGPAELATSDDSDYVVAFAYGTQAEKDDEGLTAPAYGVTRRYDCLHPGDPIETVVLADGFGRAVQTKEDAVITEGSGGSGGSGGSASAGKVMLTVSGRTVRDACGRTVKTYYPTVCDTAQRFAFSPAFDGTSPTVTAYDVLDRPVETVLPDGSVTSVSYGLDAALNASVTEVTDALGNVSKVYADGSGNTLKSVRTGGSRGEIETKFEYDALKRLVRVTDTEGNVTSSVYDKGGRRTEVSHPASGRTLFTYDAAGNMLSRRTAELAASGAAITYGYDFSLLTSVSYPGHPENDVRYVYGNRYAAQGRKGRLILREDASGATEYGYGPRGEVTSLRRTFAVPGQAVATYVTEMEYDAHGRLLSMTYPDNERVSYGYDAGGRLETVTGSKLYGTGNTGNTGGTGTGGSGDTGSGGSDSVSGSGDDNDAYGMTYRYVDRIGYDRFGQRTRVDYGNGTTTLYTYDTRRRMSGMSVRSAQGVTVTDNTYTFDAVGNVLSLVSGATAPAGRPGGVMTNRYVYDDLYRLSRATGSFTGTPAQGSPAGPATASYQLSMDYDDMHRILAKRQEITQDGIAAEGVLNVGYRLGYSYSAESPFRLDTVTDANYRTVSEPGSGDYSDRHSYTYDRNGNLTGAFTDRATLSLGKSRRASERRLAWDEENRLTAVCDNGYVSAYLYDADGERVFKASGDATHMYVNAAEAPGATTDTRSFTLYVSPYLVVCEDGRYTKHFYAGAQRIVSKVGDRASYGSDPRTIDRAGNDYDSQLRVDYEAKKAALEGAIAAQYERFGVPFRGIDHDNRTDAPRRSFADPAEYEGQQYFYHPDHLGSTSYVTDAEGNVAQHVEYVPFGEVLVDQRAADWNAPYLFNAKELDEETGLYYYGARYYDPRLSLWLSTDPLAELMPNKAAYKFSNNNPVRFIDPTGLYETEEEAYKASRQFNNAPVLQDKKSGEWFISINEYGNGAYKSGPTVTRFFGVKRPSWNSALFGVGSGMSYWQHTQYNTTLEIWRGKNNKIYQGLTGRGPNQYTGSRSVAKAKAKKLGIASDVLTIVGLISTEAAYQKTLSYDLGPNMRRYLDNKHMRDQVFNASGLFGVYGPAASFGYNLGYLIEDVGQWITGNPDFRIRYNPYTKDFTPIEKTLQEYDELGIIIY